MNLIKDLADLLRRHMDSQGYYVAKIQDDDHASLVLYHKMLRYTIAPRRRQVLKAVGFKCPPRHALGVAQLEQAIRRGNDLSPYRSKSIADLTESDGLLDYWGIHHLHLGTTQRKDGFIARTKELLFCFVDDTFAYFIKVATHDSSPWAKQELIETIHLNWPTAIEPFRLHNVVAVSPELDDADLKALRQANLVSLLTMQDGTVYREPGLGNTTGGVHIKDLRWAYAVCNTAKAVEGYIRSNWQAIVDRANVQGYSLKGTESLRLAATEPLLHWDIVDSESGYQFRQYVSN